MGILVSVFRLLAGLYILVVSVPALLALLGFAAPMLDLFNHLQLLLFFGTLAALIIALPLFGLRRLATWLAMAGFIASAAIFVPEWLSSLAPRAAAGSAQIVKLVTHNVFGLNDDMQRVAAVIAAENPDIVALQEYFPQQVQGLDRLLRPDYPYSVRCAGGKRANLGLYSKIPFDREMGGEDCPTDYDWDRGQRTAHIIAGFTLANGAHFSVLTTHMDWPYPIERQQAEFAEIASAVRAVEGPMLVVGDFNSTPWSYALKGFAAASGLERETRNLLTYPELFTFRGMRQAIPFLALDQVFQRGLVVHELHRGAESGSDHLPVVVSFSVAP
ncbi:MAG: endonuclease/exonuclease/phosphatase family protein [Devosia sp.]